jgi:hypothetical protein
VECGYGCLSNTHPSSDSIAPPRLS